jgi:hypothetical protein
VQFFDGDKILSNIAYAFWTMMLCTSVYMYRRFGGIIFSMFGEKFRKSERRWEEQRLEMIAEDLKLRECQNSSTIFALT